MSQRTIGTKAPEQTHRAVEDLQRAERMESKSRAVKKALDVGLAEMGYLSDGVGITPARKLVRRVAEVLFVAAVTLWLLSAFTAGTYTQLGAGVFVGSVAAILTDRLVLARVEPAITHKLPRVEVTRRGSP